MACMCIRKSVHIDLCRYVNMDTIYACKCVHVYHRKGASMQRASRGILRSIAVAAFFTHRSSWLIGRQEVETKRGSVGCGLVRVMQSRKKYRGNGRWDERQSVPTRMCHNDCIETHREVKSSQNATPSLSMQGRIVRGYCMLWGSVGIGTWNTLIYVTYVCHPRPEYLLACVIFTAVQTQQHVAEWDREKCHHAGSTQLGLAAAAYSSLSVALHSSIGHRFIFRNYLRLPTAGF